MAELGHNGGPDLLAADEALVMLFVRFNINDILKTLLEIRSLEERGFYMTVLFVMYDRGGYLPADDYAAARSLAVDVRTYRRMKAILLKAKRIRETEHGITQDRVQKEIERYTTEAMKRREAALKREEKRRLERELYEDFEGLPLGQERDATRRSNPDRPEWDAQELHMRSAEDRPEFSPISGRSSGEVSSKSPYNPTEIDQHLSKKTNKINDHTTTAVVDIEAQPCHKATSSLSLSHKERVVESQSLLSDTEYAEPSVASGDATRARREYSVEFLAFWANYPRTVGTSKAKAWAAWKKLSSAEKALAFGRLDAFKTHEATRLKRSLDSTGLHPTTYLNQKRWETLGDAAGSGRRFWWQDPKKVAGLTETDWEHLGRKHANGTWPIEKLGPSPASKQCLMPRQVIAKLGIADVYDLSGVLLPGRVVSWFEEGH